MEPIKRIAAIIAVLFVLSGCGQQGFMVYVEHVTVPEMENISGIPHAQGFTERREFAEYTACHVYVLDPYLYDNERCYHTTLGHEIRHCMDSDFHGDEMYDNGCSW
jgi:hypothetical protein